MIKKISLTTICLLSVGLGISYNLLADDLPKLTTLSDPDIKYQVPKKHYFVLKRGNVEAVVVDNQAVDDKILPKHRAGYNGIASLKHSQRNNNFFVPSYAGLNFEHIHDGTNQDRKILFEPRHAPMQLRVIDEHTAELYQKPTPHWGLESCLRYQMLSDGTLEMTLECIPRHNKFSKGYVGLFWASYIHQPESLDIHFKGHAKNEKTCSRWIRGITPKHGVLSTHLATNDQRLFEHEENYGISLAFNESDYRYSEPWYYGKSQGLALVLMFRPKDQIRLTQSPSGGGTGNPAWDFQFFTSDCKVGKRYQMVMRAMILPFQSTEQIERDSAVHRQALARQK